MITAKAVNCILCSYFIKFCIHLLLAKHSNIFFSAVCLKAKFIFRNRGNGNMTEYVRQELRAMVGARTQQHQVSFLSLPFQQKM